MNRIPRARPGWLLLLSLLACDEGPSGPSGSSLRVSVSGLPSGAAGAVAISGPGGYSQSATSTQTFTQLTPGSYTVTASSVTFSTSTYDPSPTTQNIAVGSTQANATVTYSLSSGNLTVTVNGLGTTGRAAVTVTGPGGYTRSVNATTTLSGLPPGSYNVAAQDAAAACGTTYTASPATQTAAVAAGGTSHATVTYSPPTGGSVNLCIDEMYLTQSTQSYSGGVPLVQNRQGYLRIFVVADRSNTEMPPVEVRFYDGAIVQSTVTIPATSFAPTAADESSLSFSWDTTVPRALIKPGLRIEAVVDPANLVAESNELDNTFPALGPRSMVVHPVPPLKLTFVPVLQSGLLGNVTATNKNTYLDLTRRMHPIDSVNAVVDTPMTTSATLQADGEGWTTVLLELNARRVADSTRAAYDGYYYGVTNVLYSSGVAGVAYVTSGPKAALGWDRSDSRGKVAAHELGHNWGRLHAPCGGPAQLDAGYPYTGGTTGVYGLDLGTIPRLVPPSATDVMGYCNDQWISDYTYKAVLSYFNGPTFLASSTPLSQPVQPTLLVWGHINDGEVSLEPAFQIETRPSLPTRSGPYSVEGHADDGSKLFAFSFAPDELADAPGRRANFVFAVPMSAATGARLASLRLTAPGVQAPRTTLMTTRLPAGSGAQVGVRSDSVEVRRRGKGRVRLHWNAGVHPMVMVRDPETGKVLSFARNGSAEVLTSKAEVDLVLSDGIKSSHKRVRVAQ